MKNALLLTILLFSLSGCTFVRDELQTSGGGFGGIADRAGYYPVVQRPELQVYRGVVSMTLLSRLAQGAINDADSAETFVNSLVAASRSLNDLSGHVFVEAVVERPVSDAPPEDEQKPERPEGEKEPGPVASSAAAAAVEPGHYVACAHVRMDSNRDDGDEDRPRVAVEDDHCLNYAAFFESDLPPFESSLFRLALNALPGRDVEEFAERVTSGNIFSAIFHAIRVAGRYAWGAHNAAAAYRSERQLFADTLMHQEGASHRGLPGSERHYVSVEQALALFSELERPDNPDAARSLAYLNEIRIDEETLRPLYVLIRDACLSLPRLSLEDIRHRFSLDDEGTAEKFDSLTNDRLLSCNGIRFRPNVRERYARTGRGSP